MKYAFDMGSGATIYIPSFIKIGPGIPKLIGREDTQTHRHTQARSHKPTSGNRLTAFKCITEVHMAVICKKHVSV
jgi:hypothetical protein